MILTRRAQTMLEYTIIVGVVTVVLYYMGTSIKRGMQSLVKVTADQIGNQQNSDQDFTDYQQGYMNQSLAMSQSSKIKQLQELGYRNASGVDIYTGNTAFSESTVTMTNTLTNGGFSPTE